MLKTTGAALASMLITGCYATVSHRPDEPVTLESSGQPLLTVVPKVGEPRQFDAPVTTSIEAKELVVRRQLIPVARFDAASVQRVEVATYQPTPSRVAIGVGLTAAVAATVGLLALVVVSRNYLDHNIANGVGGLGGL